ncbi:MAG TPA: chloride channel protein [Candidatus Saccharimonadales bacterium]
MSVILGIAVGLISDLFIRAIQLGTRLIWQDLVPHAIHHPLAVILISLAGGIIMGLCVKYFGTNEGIGFEAVMASVKEDGALGVKQLKRVVVNTYAGLLAGASIGPEAPLVTLGGYVGDWLGRRLKVTKEQIMSFIAIALGGSLGILLNAPVAGSIMFAENPVAEDKKANTLLIFASMVAASIGFGIYVLLKAPFLHGVQLVPSYSGFKPVQLVYGFIIGIIGMAIGLSMKYGIIHLKSFNKKYLKNPIIRGGIVGIIVGIIGSIWPLAMFDGTQQLSQLVTHTASYTVIGLLVLCLVRVITTSVSLGGGYQGGNIFPTLFAAGAAGLAIHGMFGFVPAAVAVVACMASSMYVFTPLPLFTIFLITDISSFSLIPVMTMALVSSYLINIIKPSTAKSNA